MNGAFANQGHMEQKVLRELSEKNELTGQLENSKMMRWALDRLKVMEQSTFLVEVYVMVLTVLNFELARADIDAEQLQGYLLILMFATSFLRVPLTLLCALAERTLESIKDASAKVVKPWKSSKFWQVAIRCLVCLAIPNYFLRSPRFVIYYTDSSSGTVFKHTFNDVLTVFTIARFLYSLNLIKNFSSFNTNSVHRVSRLFRFKNGFRFMFRCYFKEQSLFTTLVLSITILAAFSYAIRVFEYQNPVDDFTSYFNSLWFTVVTFCTIGYGDYVPMSGFGRMAAATLGFTGVLGCYLITLVLIENVQMSQSEEQALDFFTRRCEQEQVSLRLRRVLVAILRMNVARKTANSLRGSLVWRRAFQRMVDAQRDYQNYRSSAAREFTVLRPERFMQIDQFQKNLATVEKELRRINRYTGRFSQVLVQSKTMRRDPGFANDLRRVVAML